MAIDTYLPLNYLVGKEGIPFSPEQVHAEIEQIWNDASQEQLMRGVADALLAARLTGKTRPGDKVVIAYGFLDRHHPPKAQRPLTFTISRVGVPILKETMKLERT